MKKIAIGLAILLTGCNSIPKTAIQDNKLQLDLSDKIINKISKVKALYDLALIARGLI